MMFALLLAAAQPAPMPVTVIDAERAFASDAQKIGQWSAFAKWADPKGVLVVRKTVNARQFAGGLPNPALPVSWWPATAYVSCDGQVAVTTGPYFDPTSGTTGRFTTIWHRTKAGWRFLVDMGQPLDKPIAAGDKPQIVRPECKIPALVNLPALISNDLVEHDSGHSPDRSLQWSWSRSASGDRFLNVQFWKDASYVDAYKLSVARPQ